MSLEQMELQLDLFELEILGLNEEELEGYLCFFMDNYTATGEVV